MKTIVRSALFVLLFQAVCSHADVVTNIAAGLYHSLFLKPNGSLWAMGQNNVGQLGDSTSNNTNRPKQIVTNGVVAVAAGSSHSLFLKSDGSLWAMGYDEFGQLGDGTNTSGINSTPAQIVPSGVTAISGGGYHSLFLMSDGSLWAMGRDVEGQLGDGNFHNEFDRPEQIVPSGVTAIAGGEYHSVFLKSDGSAWAMGANNDGQLGDGTLINTNRPEEIVSNGVIALAAGFNHSLFLKSDGSLWATGDDSYGQLGIGKYNSGTNRPMEVVSNGVLAIDAGGNTSLFLKSGGSFWSMGQNSYGTNGTLSNSNRPVQIVASGVVALARGHTHGLFAKSDGSIWAMGDDSLGQLGDGFTNSTSIPEQIFPTPQPALTSITASGTNLQFQATSPSGGTVYLLAGTNLMEPFSQALVLSPVKNAIEYQPECLDRILDYCGGNPFYMHLVCLEVFQRCVNDERTFVGENDLYNVQLSRCRTLGETNFAHLWEDNPELEESSKHRQTAQNCLVLTCMALLNGHCDSAEKLSERQETLGLNSGQRMSTSEITQVLDRLRNRKVVRKAADSSFEIAVPIFRDWLVSNAELLLLPRWKDYCNKELPPTKTAEIPTAPSILESAFPISEDDLLPVAHNLVYCGKEKDVAEIRSWLRQFDDDVRIVMAFDLLQRLSERGFISEGKRRHFISVLEDAIAAAHADLGGVWRIVSGKKDNLCISFIDSGSEMKSGAAIARDIANSLRPGKRAQPHELVGWMRNHKDQDAMVVLVDEFAASGSQLVAGTQKFLQGVGDKSLVERYLEERRIVCCLLCAFSEAREKLSDVAPNLKIVTAHLFGEDVRALEPEAEIFENEADRKFAEEMLVQIGTELCPQMPLGWARFGALVCFHNSVPNNTLPIFWSDGKVNDKPWRPLFPRP